MKKLIFTLPIIALAACAEAPSAIAPTSMGNAYSSASCAKAHYLRAEEIARLNSLSQAQSQAAVADAIGVFLFLVPIGSVSGGNKAGEIADAKGRIASLDARLARC
jgi:hypothetical protein